MTLAILPQSADAREKSKSASLCTEPRDHVHLPENTGGSPDLSPLGMHRSPHQTGKATAGQGIIPLCILSSSSSSLSERRGEGGGEGGGGGLLAMMSSAHMQSNSTFTQVAGACTDYLYWVA